MTIDGVLSYLMAPISWLVLAVGLMVGSFLNVCIYRIPEGTFWAHLRSVCRHCQAPIPAYYNLPLISYLMLRGKSACCQKSISIQYPLVELGTGLLFLLVYWQFPFVEVYQSDWIINNPNLLRFTHAIVFSCLLLICSVIDLHHMIIPDVISLPMIAATPLVVWLHPELGWQDALIGVVVGGGSLYLVAWLYYLIRGEIGMGFGDVKLLAAIGGWLGYQAIFPTIFTSSIVGSIVGIVAIIFSGKLSMKSAIPFGPFLALGAFLHLVLRSSLLSWIF